jgi:hypothetical protein
MSNTKKLPAGGRHVPQHRKQPSRATSTLAAVPGGWGAKIATAGLAGAALAIPAAGALATPASAATTPASPVTATPAATATGIPGITQAGVSNAIKTLFQEQSPASAAPAPATGGDAILAQNPAPAPPAASGSVTVTFPDGTDHTFPLGTRVNPTDPTVFGPGDEIEVPLDSTFTDPSGPSFLFRNPGTFPLGPGLPTLRILPGILTSDNSTGTTTVALNDVDPATGSPVASDAGELAALLTSGAGNNAIQNLFQEQPSPPPPPPPVQQASASQDGSGTQPQDAQPPQQVASNPTLPATDTNPAPQPAPVASNPTPPTTNTSQPAAAPPPPNPPAAVASNPTPPTTDTSPPQQTAGNPTPPTDDTNPPPIVVASNPSGGGTTG